MNKEDISRIQRNLSNFKVCYTFIKLTVHTSRYSKPLVEVGFSITFPRNSSTKI